MQMSACLFGTHKRINSRRTNNTFTLEAPKCLRLPDQGQASGRKGDEASICEVHSESLSRTLDDADGGTGICDAVADVFEDALIDAGALDLREVATKRSVLCRMVSVGVAVARTTVRADVGN